MIPIEKISGLVYVPEWVSSTDEEALVNLIEQQPWSRALRRRVQQYGAEYDYTTKSLNSSYLEIPQWLLALAKKINFAQEPNQIIINEYEPGQGITRHIDSPYFGPTVASLSLVNSATMIMGQYRGTEYTFAVERRSLLIMNGDARSKWFHCIPPVTDKRISITFRTVPHD